MKKSVVWNQDHTPWIANVHLETDGMADMLKSMESNIVMTLIMDMRNKLRSPGDNKLLKKS